VVLERRGVFAAAPGRIQFSYPDFLRGEESRENQDRRGTG